MPHLAYFIVMIIDRDSTHIHASTSTVEMISSFLTAFQQSIVN
jgi:hypothetical protein